MVRPTIKLQIASDETQRQEFKVFNTLEKRHLERFTKLREFIKEHSYSPSKDGPAEMISDNY
jgi:hypothetical protein